MTPLIAVHAFAATTSILLGGWQLFFSEKGSMAHQVVGRIWVALMLFVSVSSFWIHELRPGRFSLLHILSVVTIVTVSQGIIAARRGNLRAHVGNMRGSWIGLCFAGVFAGVVPERAIPQFAVDDPVGAVAAGAAVIATSAAVIGLGRLATTLPRWQKLAMSPRPDVPA